MSKYDNLSQKSIFDFCDDPRVTDLFLELDETKEDYLDWIDVTPSPIQIPPFPGAPKQDELTLPGVRRWEDLLKLSEILGDEELTNAIFKQYDRAGELVLYWGEEFTELQQELSGYSFVDLSKEKDLEAAKKLLLEMSDGQLVYTLRSNAAWVGDMFGNRTLGHGLLDAIGEGRFVWKKFSDKLIAPILRESIQTEKSILVHCFWMESCDGDLPYGELEVYLEG